MDEKRWTNEQKLAIEVNGSNILVSASAGSGKTAVLVERVVSKVIHSRIDIDRILVVTFTNASAVELKERLLLAIYKAIDEDKNNLFLKKQLEYLNRATITTIHSFCLEVIRSNFYNLGIDPNVSICDDTMSKLLKAKAFNNELENEYINYKEDVFCLYNVLNLFNNKDEEFLEYMFKIYSYINSFEYPLEWLMDKINKYNIQDLSIDLYTLDFGKEIYDTVISDLFVISEKIKRMIEETQDVDDFNKHVEMLNIDLENINRCIKCSNGSWDLLFEHLNMIEYISFPRNKVSNDILKEKLQNFRKTVVKDEVAKMKNSIYAKSIYILQDLKNTYKYLEYIYYFLEKGDSTYKELKKEANYIDFNDIEHMALKVLVNRKLVNEKYEYVSTEQANKYKEKFIEVYTDEYQDTSFVQEAILNAVSNGNNRFMVGDIKQSIYKFRQAMPEIFNCKYSIYPLINSKDEIYNDCNGVKIVLAKNFRSRKSVLDSINYIFTQILSNDIGDCDYLTNEMLEFGNEGYIQNEQTDYSSEINILNVKDIEKKDDDEDSEDENTESLEYINELKDFEIEAKYIAERIKNLVNVNPFKVYNMKKGIFEDAKYKDIVILLRNIKDKGNILTKILKDNNIQAFADSNINLFDNDEIKLVLSFLKIVDNPLQDIEIVSLMYNIVGKFTIDEIYKIKNYNKKEYIYNCLKSIPDTENSELLNKVKIFLDLINKFKEYAEIYNVSEILARIYKETNLYNQVLLFSKSNESKINLDSLIDVAIRFDANSSIYLFITYIEELKEKSSGDTTTAKVIGENENVVRIMTIHKSKGLEFPIVILAGTNVKYITRDISSAIVLDHKLGIGINIVDEDTNITYSSVIKEGIKTSMVRSMKSEELRMLYVALTRAKEKLIIYSTMKDYNKKILSMFLMYKEGKIDTTLIKKNSTYIDNILMALYKYINDNEEQKSNLFKINVIDVKSKENINNIVSKQKKSFDNIGSILSAEYNLRNQNEKNKIEDEVKVLKNNIEFEYKYIEDTLVNKKISVSELKKNKYEEEDITVSDLKILKTPECLENKELKYTAVRKGSLIHFILEHLDLVNVNTKDDIYKYIDNLVENKVINLNDKKQISVNMIYDFLNSKIGKEIKQSSKVKREIEFVLKDETFSKSIIQGVIDMYYLNDDNTYTLVDFKTDNLLVPSEYISRYKLQLDIYKEAIEKLTSVKVSKVYIYSFKLNKEIEIYE
ncbi:MAG: helicase-exonuclease AddAB subunit AddA [Clostridia bacterium]|nr:helicase-exonuclease AddAB subunit AddA [Clostridia bacterium]MDD4387001.1 helicase-exonuclease AddAB subunit AddA [Clostridia bacterium]